MRDPQHVAVNALFLDPGVSGGPETYVRGLVAGLREAIAACRFELVTTRRGAAALRSEGWDDVTAMPCDEGERIPRAWAEQVRLPAHARRAGADLIHSTASLGPGWTPGVAHVVTVHDVTFFRESTFGRVTTAAMKAMMTAASRDADALLSGSAAARDDIAATLKLDPGTIDVVHHGTRPIGPAEPEAAVRDALQLPDGRPVIVCVASKRPHKNQELLIRALPLLADDRALLVLVGHAEPYDALLRSLADELEVAARVRFAEGVDDRMLEGLWRIADVAAFPTKGEGFGLPVVEAMLRGVPVACSDIEVLREVGGGHAALFSPTDPVTAAAAIDCALALGRDAGEVAAARKHAEAFTWLRAARETFDVYRRACSA
jgi:glycosyltransferase involved in cell wall biosynthesis